IQLFATGASPRVEVFAPEGFRLLGSASTGQAPNLHIDAETGEVRRSRSDIGATLEALAGRVAELEAAARPVLDTGWRDLTGTLMYGWTGGAVFARRVADEVMIVFKGLDGTEATNAGAVPLPSGFGPDTFTGGSQAF